MALELFDLNALVTADAADGCLAAVGRAVRQASSMSSVKNDLARAGEMFAACKQLQHRLRGCAEQGVPIDRSDAATVQALFAQAVLLYTRAVHSKGAGRNKLQITNHLSVPMRAQHDRIVELRDRYFAHFGQPGEWERHAAVLALDIEKMQMALSYPHESYYVRADESREFEALLQEVRAIGEAAYARASERLNLLLNELFDEDSHFLDKLRAHPFSPDSFFEAEEIEAYLAALGRLDPDAPTSPRVIVPGDRAAGPAARRKGGE